MAEHFDEVSKVLKLDENGYEVSLKKSTFFEKEVDWCGSNISEKEVK